MNTTRPFATLGDTVRENWRAQLRAEGIARRQDSQLGRPDRGYVDQAPPVTPRLTMPLSKLQEAKELSDEDWLAANDPPAPVTTPQAVGPDEEDEDSFEDYHEESTQPEPPALVRVERPSEPRPIPMRTEQRIAQMLERAPETAAEPLRREAPMGEGVARVGADGRKFYTEEFKARVVAAAEAEAGNRTYRDVANEFDIGVSNVTNWVRSAQLVRARESALVARAARREAAKAERQTTLLSRPQPPAPAQAPRSRVARRGPTARTIEDVSAELQEAKERVKALKAELLELLED